MYESRGDEWIKIYKDWILDFRCLNKTKWDIMRLQMVESNGLL